MNSNLIKNIISKSEQSKVAVSQIACILAASWIFSGYYLVMTSLSCQICGKTPAKLTES